MLTVEKIGGTSMSGFDEVLKNIIIGNRKPSEMYNRVFVVSAYNNVTNWLLEHKKQKNLVFTVNLRKGRIIMQRWKISFKV